MGLFKKSKKLVKHQDGSFAVVENGRIVGNKSGAGRAAPTSAGPVRPGSETLGRWEGEFEAQWAKVREAYERKLRAESGLDEGRGAAAAPVSEGDPADGWAAPVPRCAACGQFVSGDGGHRCAKRMLVTWAPGVNLAGTAGLMAQMFAAGPLLVGAVAVGGLALGALRYWLLKWQRDETWSRGQSRLSSPDEAARLQSLRKDVDELLPKTDVQGEVLLMVENELVKGRVPQAAAAGSPEGRHIIMLNEKLLDLPEESRRAVIAHELAHLEKPYSPRTSVILRAVAFPVGLSAGAVAGATAGMGAVAAGAVGALGWFAVKVVTSALSRREERRADREAYRLVGEDFPVALERVNAYIWKGVRADMPWRAEDLMATHGNLPNRIADMRKHASQG